MNLVCDKQLVRVRSLVPLIFLTTVAPMARAQCPDGSPPPCRATPVATPSPTVRRVNPPLDDRTWIVVPFDNLAKRPEVDWLRAASVNLLYLDMSRWRDIRVIDDERVADLVRETPEAKEAATLSLNAGLAVAKRAGAGKLVMGDVLQLGSRTTVTAKVFDVRTGQRLRSVREETTVQDSVMALFGKLAQKVLNLAAPRGVNVGALGTSVVEAYQEYVAGVDALNKYDLAKAHRHFENALKLDSSFALAHYKLNTVLGWENPNEASRRAHAEAASRLAGVLPPRERALIAGSLQQTVGEWTKSCETYGALVRADSADVEAWNGLGECLFHDPTMEAVAGDSSRMRFRSDFDRSIRAFTRVLQLDPTYHVAYQHIIDALVSEQGQRCIQSAGVTRCYAGFFIRRGDSLVITPLNSVADAAKLRAQAQEYVLTRSRRRNLDLAQVFAAAWVQASPDEAQAHRALARVLVLQGHLKEAQAELALVRVRGTIIEELRRTLESMEIAYKLGRGLEAIRLYDSVRANTDPVPGSSIRFGNAVAGYAPAFGRLTEFDSLVALGIRIGNAPAVVSKYASLGVRGMLTGVASDSLIAAERAVFDSVKSRSIAYATRTITPTLMYNLRAPRAQWMPVDTANHDPRLAPALALAARDTAKLRVAAQALDSLAALMSSAGGSDSGYAIIAADAYLVLRDSTAALRALRFGLDAASATTPYFPQSSNQFPPVYVVPRMMLLRADLAAAAGQREEAREWYRRFIDTWSTAVPELQPLVERARRSLAGIGTT